MGFKSQVNALGKELNFNNLNILKYKNTNIIYNIIP